MIARAIVAAMRFAGVAGVTAAKLLTFRAGGLMLSAVERKHFAISLLGEWGRTLVERLGLQIEIHGAPASLPSLWVGNHRSYLDIPVLESQVPCLFLAKHEISRWPLFGRAARAGGMVFVKRGDRADRRRALEEIRGRIAGGASMVVFAEGTTSPGPGLLAFKPGALRLAYESGVNIATFAVVYDDAELAWVGDDTFVGHFWRVFGFRGERKVRVAFGRSLDPRNFPSAEALCMAAREHVLELTEYLEGVACRTALASPRPSVPA